MGVTLCIGDLHLDGQRPAMVAAFEDFLEAWAGRTERLYILGDLFEYWIGDDYRDPVSDAVAEALRSFASTGSEVYFLVGNRDFLLGEDFAASAGMTLLTEPVTVLFDETPALLLHGDALCTDDVEYQRFRAMVRDLSWQEAFLDQPVSARLEYARKARKESQRHTQASADKIMDVNQQAVDTTMRQHGTQTLIHGHTHRPAIHEFTLGARPARRMVVGDWYTQGSVLIYSGGAFSLESISGPASS